MAKKQEETATLPRLDAFLVDEFEVDGHKKSSWSKIGSAWPHQDGNGYRIVLKAFPADGVVVLRTPGPKQD